MSGKIELFGRDYATESTCRVVVIGAGASGLAALGALRRQGFSDVLLLEQGDGIGGVWDTVNYPELEIHSKSYNYKFYNFPPPASRTEHATRQEVLDYFAAYVDAFDLRQYICLGHRVDKIVRMPHGEQCHRCEVHIQSSGCSGERVLKCSYVVCGLGFTNAGAPNFPVFSGQGSFSGTVVHSSSVTEDTLDKVASANQQVCLLGAGKSAYDIALLFRKRGLAKHLTWIYKKSLWGLNYDFIYSNRPGKAQTVLQYYKYLYELRRSPASEEVAALAKAVVETELLLNIDGGAALDPYQTRSAIYKPQELSALVESVQRVKSSIRSMTGRTVELENGETIEADLVICCTGHARAMNLPVIERQDVDGGMHKIDPREQPMLYRGMIDVELPELILFTGELLFSQQLFGFSLAAEWVGRYIASQGQARVQLSEMREQLAEDSQALNSGVDEEFKYSWISQGSLSKGHGYFIGEASMRYLKQVLYDLGIKGSSAVMLCMDPYSKVGFERISQQLASQVTAASTS